MQNFALKAEELDDNGPAKTIATNTHDVFVEVLSNNNTFELDENWDKRITLIEG